MALFVVISEFLECQYFFGQVVFSCGVVSEVCQFTSSGLKGIFECFGAQICGREVVMGLVWFSVEQWFIVCTLRFGGLAILLSSLLIFMVKSLKSLNISVGLALDAVGTNDSPLFRNITCVLDSWVSERLTMLCLAHPKQSRLRHSSGMWSELFCCF